MLAWLQSEVLPKAVKTGSFGANVKKFVGFEQNTKKGSDQFASDVIFGDVELETKGGQLVKEEVTIKVQPKNEAAQKVFNCDAQFSNEVMFYSDIVPLFQKYDTDNVLKKYFPEFLYGVATNGVNPKEDVIVMKNMNSEGFRLTEERVFLDKKHIDLAIEGIAKFHALSYKCSHEDPVGFEKVVAKIQSTFRDTDEGNLSYLSDALARGINPLKDDPDYKDRLADLYRHCEKVDEWRSKYMLTSEDLNVIAHGDFLRNNMMFRYGDAGEPVEVKFFDLATIKYCSPTVDTANLLMFNTSPKVKQSHFESFLKLYYRTLSDQMREHPAKPTWDEVLLDFRKRGIYGYYTCSFFQPMMLSARTKEDLEDVDFSDPEVRRRMILQMGGDEATEYLTAAVKHMLETEFIFEQ